MNTLNTIKRISIFVLVLTSLGFSAENKSPAILLQEGIYAEQTEGDLEKAITIYKKIVDESQEPQRIAAKATYQLGMCYLKKDDKEKAAEYFKKVVSNYPEQKQLVEKAQSQLKKNKLAAKPLKFIKTPFVHGETSVYNVVMKLTGQTLGQIVYKNKIVERNGRQLNRIEMYSFFRGSDAMMFSATEFDPETLMPVYSISKSWMGTCETNYSSNKIKFKNTINGRTTEKEIKTDGVVYEDFGLIEHLPLKKGYSAEFDTFVPFVGQVYHSRITVVGKEKVKWFGEEIVCYKVKQEVLYVGVPVIKMESWISDDDRRIAIKTDEGKNAIINLVKVSIEDYSEPVMVVDKKQGYEFKLPPEWLFGPSTTMNGTYKFSKKLISPEMKIYSVFVGTEKSGPQTTAKAIAEADITALNDFFKNYKVREDSWNVRKINGMDAATFAADYEDKNVKKVEYRTYIAGDSLVYWFVFRMEKDEFEKRKKELDSIVSSFKVKATSDKGVEK